MSKKHDGYSEEVRRVAEHIADTLGEHQPSPRRQILAIVRLLGPQVALDLLEEAKQVQAAGGLWLPDRSRKRTFGGVFFFLARQRLGKAWPQTYGGRSHGRPRPRGPFPWEQRKPFVAQALKHQCTAQDVHTVVRWQAGTYLPKRVSEGSIIILPLIADKRGIPRGLPHPNQQGHVVVLIHEKKLPRGVTLIARGAPLWHHELGLVVSTHTLRASPHPITTPTHTYLHVTLNTRDIRWTRATPYLLLVAARWQRLPLVLYVSQRMWNRARGRVEEVVVLSGQAVVDKTHVVVLVDQITPPLTSS